VPIVDAFVQLSIAHRNAIDLGITRLTTMNWLNFVNKLVRSRSLVNKDKQITFIAQNKAAGLNDVERKGGLNEVDDIYEEEVRTIEADRARLLSKTTDAVKKSRVNKVYRRVRLPQLSIGVLSGIYIFVSCSINDWQTPSEIASPDKNYCATHVAKSAYSISVWLFM
jgi:hypothetical protein